MPCCSSCDLPIQGHQLPTIPRCSILLEESSHASGLEPKCTMCAQPCSSHPKGKQINKECKFCWQQVPVDIASDEMDPLEANDIHMWLMHITQKNHAIKSQLSQLTDLVWQLFQQQPPASQATQQATHTRNSHPELLPAKEQFPSAQASSLSLLPPSWPEPREAAPGEPSSSQQTVHPSPAVQTTAHECCASLPAVATPPERPSPIPSFQTQHNWVAPLGLGPPQAVLSMGHHQPALTASQPPAQVPASIHGKVQCSEYIDLSELLVCDFQHKYSGLDDSQTLEIVDRKLALAPKCKSRHLSTLQIWLKAWHIYEDTVICFFRHRYQELSHYQHHIVDLDQHFKWAVVLSYDAQFHHKCSMQGLPFSAFDQQLYMTC